MTSLELQELRNGSQSYPSPIFAKAPALRRRKRVVDVILAAALIVALAPLLLAIGAAIRAGGNRVLFRHRRVGADGRAFNCLKFQTMCPDADRRLNELLEADPAAKEEWQQTQKLRNDPRVTGIGRFLRRTSLDELPQLFNVLRGEMSLVGPRPIVREEVEKYGGCFAHYLRCRPGMTGLWQVSGRSDTSYAERVRLDVAYAGNWRLTSDLAILVRTVGVVLRGSGSC